MRKLILVKHSAVVVQPDVPAAQWRLSDVGRARCVSLARMLAEYAPTVIVASDEPKAVETADTVAGGLGLSVETEAGLREHDRADVPYHRDGAEFERADAEHWFATAVGELLARRPTGNVIVVAHGTVITLLIARHNRVEPYQCWRRLGLPSFAVLSMPDMILLDTVVRVDSDAADRER